jgi:predicted acylesterase/phospholipase RssA
MQVAQLVPTEYPQGLRRPAWLLVLSPVASIVWVAFTPVSLGRNSAAFVGSLLPGRFATTRSANRTDALRASLAANALGTTTMDRVTHHGLTTVFSATDLLTTKAVRFSSHASSCSAYGRILEPITVAEAVAASAAFPALLPAIERRFTFVRDRDGTTTVQRVALTDGGVYDNLGLSVLEPGRSPKYTDHTYQLDYIIACDAATGEPDPANSRYWPTRLARSYSVTHRKSQDGGRGRLHHAVRAGELTGFVHAYLGMPDARLPVPVVDLIPYQRTRSYGTNFRAMGADDLHAITTRGEQLTRTLVQHYCPQL